MGLTLPAVPNLNVQPPQIANPLDQQAKMLQLKNLMGQQQLLPLQVQEQQEKVKQEQTANQMSQLELQSQQAMMKAWSDPKFLDKFTGTDKASSSGLGFDPDALSSSLISQGVLPKDAMSMTQMFVDRSQKIAATAKDVSQAGEAQAALREKGFKTLADRIGGVLDAPASKAGDLLAQLKQDLVKNKDAFAGVPQEDLAHVYSADLEHLPSMATLIGLDSKIADYHKSKSEATSAQQNVIPEGATMSPKQAAEGAKEVAVAKAEQPLKIETAEAEGRARQLIQGMAEPVYAMDAQGNKVLMSKTDALRSRAVTILPVNEKQVSEDTMLINRLGDVRQKIAQYEQAISKLGTTVSAKDQSNIAGLIGKGKFAVGAFGTELPMDRLNAALDKENISGLSDDAKKLLVSYYNARESMNGYQRVLTGSGRGSEKAMELNLDALPNPGTADAGYAAEALRQFKQNLQIVGQGLPKIPGIKSPEEIEAQAGGTQPSQPKKSTSKAAKYGVEIQ